MSVVTPRPQSSLRIKPWLRPLKRSLKAAAAAAALIYFIPEITIFYVLCGIYDAARNRPVSLEVLDKYFLGNGVGTWVMSPFNILLDLLCLPYRNKGVYRLEDLPEAYQQELRHVIDSALQADLVTQLQEKTRDHARTMFFFKWYGANVDTTLKIPAFHADYRYVKTIGVSVFNKKEWTSKHFGYTRASLRVLYNINDSEDASAYIQVGAAVNYWRDNKLFIFDDTLMHQSINDSDKPRYCLFIDIVRPSLLPAVLGVVIDTIRIVAGRVNSIFYNRWKLLRA
jgi:beta-hydroxylase